MLISTIIQHIYKIKQIIEHLQRYLKVSSDVIIYPDIRSLIWNHLMCSLSRYAISSLTATQELINKMIII
jgi:hypothetical protein